MMRSPWMARALVGCTALAVVGLPTAPASADEGGVSPVAGIAAGLTTSAADPLGGMLIAIDPGHQLGNHNYPDEINRLVPAGGFKKPCNTTGTSTNGGYPEATFNFQVARRVRSRLIALGATVKVTRRHNRQDLWGPCVDRRGRFGNKADADLKLSIHGDGSVASGRGFHVIAPTSRKKWTADIFKSSKRLAFATRRGLRSVHLKVSNYAAGGDGIDFRGDLGTLNLSDVPTVMVELGNMRNPGDARLMRSQAGRARFARGLVHGIRRFLG